MREKILRPFHLAFPVKNIEETKKWYMKKLGCTIGRESKDWIDFNFFGHQISAHLTEVNSEELIPKNHVDSMEIPIRHFGIILQMDDWTVLADRLNKTKTNFIIKPYTRFKGKKGEQSTFFIKDPSGNFLEFKAFAKDSLIFND